MKLHSSVNDILRKGIDKTRLIGLKCIHLVENIQKDNLHDRGSRRLLSTVVNTEIEVSEKYSSSLRAR